MRSKGRMLGVLATAGILTLGMLATALPVSADIDDVAIDMANATASIADYNADAVSAEATGGPPDNVSCTLGAFAAANTKRVVVPGFVTVHGQDVATADGVCSDLDAVDPDNYQAFLDIAFEYLVPGTSNTWIEYARRGCERPSVQGQAAFPECTHIHQFFNPADPIQDYVRRAVFYLGIYVDGVKQVRSTRTFGPLPPRCQKLAEDASGVCNVGE